jgi:hypothetical protein
MDRKEFSNAKRSFTNRQQGRTICRGSQIRTVVYPLAVPASPKAIADYRACVSPKNLLF